MKKSAMLLNLIAALAIASVWHSPAAATTGPGCLRVVNIAPGDALNVRKRPSAASRIVASIIPAQQGNSAP